MVVRNRISISSWTEMPLAYGSISSFCSEVGTVATMRLIHKEQYTVHTVRKLLCGVIMRSLESRQYYTNTHSLTGTGQGTRIAKPRRLQLSSIKLSRQQTKRPRFGPPARGRGRSGAQLWYQVLSSKWFRTGCGMYQEPFRVFPFSYRQNWRVSGFPL